MNPRERFANLMAYQPVDRLPLYFFGTWPETKTRWLNEGLTTALDRGTGCGGPQVPPMDPDWETNPDGQGDIWNNQGILDPNPLGDGPWQTIEETPDYRTIRSPFGGLSIHSTRQSTIPQQLLADLQPTRDDWNRFKRFLNPHDPRRWLPGHQARIAANNQRSHMTCFMAGSLYGWLRNWMGVEAISLLMYDDRCLFHDMVSDLTDYFLALAAQLLAKTNFDLAYVFEDCCGRSGPLFSPDIYQEIYHPHYQRLINFYHDHGIPNVLVDSDGDVKHLLPCWLNSGFDIIFPIEVGTWNASPLAYRQQYGTRLRMIGGIDKHIIPQGPQAIRNALTPLIPLAQQGGYLPMPDHRIPPDCSLAQFQTYLQIFQEVFNTPVS